MTNVSCKRFKQLGFKKNSFVIDILSFLVQNFNPTNLERKLDSRTEKEMVKFSWEECILHDFVRYKYKIENYAAISKPNITYQKANEIVKNFINEHKNRINYLKYKNRKKV